MYALNATTGSKLWSYTTGTAVDSSPAVANGVLYVTDDSNMVGSNTYALDAKTGTTLWIGVGEGGSPAVANGVVYIGVGSHLFALDAKTGTTLWDPYLGDVQHEYPPGYISDSPSVADGVVYFAYSGFFNGSVYALDAKTGDYLGGSDVVGHNIYSSPAVANGVLYFGSDDGNVYAYHLPGTQP